MKCWIRGCRNGTDRTIYVRGTGQEWPTCHVHGKSTIIGLMEIYGRGIYTRKEVNR